MNPWWASSLENGAHLDNYSAHAISWDGNVYPTVEHAYQAARFLLCAPALAERIRLASSPGAAKRMANGPAAVALEPAHWDTIKVDIMGALLRAKLTQHPEIEELLRSSEEFRLVEMNDQDSFWDWGPGPAHAGENTMGKLWMKHRSELMAP